MAILKCKMCGGDLSIADNAKIAECEFCGTAQTVPDGNDEKKANLFNRANKLRMDSEFDKAAGVYESIVSEYPDESEGYWGLVLCTFGIEYVDDAKTGKKIPTCHRTCSQSVMDDDNFSLAYENADVVAKSIYREEAKAIDRLQQQIISIVENEEPYDVFICYKETDDISKDRTEDSLIAQDIYTELIKEGYKVFFSRVTLRDKAGTEYEPYIYAALKSAKIMLAIGTKFEYYDAVWVKNEWSRYISMMSDDNSKHLIPCYKNLDAYDIPKEFKNLQALDLGGVTFFKNLLDNVDRFIPKRTTEQPKTVNIQADSNSATVDSLLKRAFMFLEEGAEEKADEYAEKVLDINPECGDAYLIKLMLEYKISRIELLEKINCFAGVITVFSYTDKLKMVKAIIEATKLGISEAKTLAENLPCKIHCRPGITRLLKAAGAEFEAEGNADEIVEIENLFDIKKNSNYIKLLKFNFSPITDKAIKDFDKAFERENEYIYENAVSKMKTATNTAQYKYLKNIFDGISNYKDSAKLSRECTDNINLILKENEEKYKIYFKKPHLSFGIWRGCVPVALKNNGTIVSAECETDYKNWCDIVSISVGYENVAGLKSDGTVVAYYGYGENTDISTWKDIVDVSAGNSHLAGLKSDGTVVAACSSDRASCNVSDWSDIVKIKATPNGTVGLKSDGTILLAGDFSRCSASEFKDAIDCSYQDDDNRELILTSAGTVKSVNGDSIETSDLQNIIALSAGWKHSVALRNDGTVWSVGDNEDGQCETESWQNVIAIDAENCTTIALKSDGTMVTAGSKKSAMADFADIVMPASGKTAKEIFEKRLSEIAAAKEEATRGFFDKSKKAIIKNIQSCISAGGYYTVAVTKDGAVLAAGDNDDGQCNVSEWKDIVSVSAGISHTLGLRSDGSVVVAGDNPFSEFSKGDVSVWNDIIAITSGAYHAAGLKSDGRVVIVDSDKEACRDIESWENIVAIAAGCHHTVGLKADGTVVAAGSNDDGQCDVSDWKNIIAVAASSYHTVGLKADGNVVIAGDKGNSRDYTTLWENIVAISAGEYITVGLKNDGTVLAVGDNDRYDRISGWKDIVAISASGNHIVGLKKDGTIVTSGDSELDNITSQWKNICLPADVESWEELKSEREKQIRIAKEEQEEENIRILQEKKNEELRLEELRRKQLEYRNAGLCQHCGGEFKGLFSKKCVKCGKTKDY